MLGRWAQRYSGVHLAPRASRSRRSICRGVSSRTRYWSTSVSSLFVLRFDSKEFFDGDDMDHSCEPPSAKGLAVFRDPNCVNGIKRTATSINWHPDGPTKISVSYR